MTLPVVLVQNHIAVRQLSLFSFEKSKNALHFWREGPCPSPTVGDAVLCRQTIIYQAKDITKPLIWVKKSRKSC